MNNLNDWSTRYCYGVWTYCACVLMFSDIRALMQRQVSKFSTCLDLPGVVTDPCLTAELMTPELRQDRMEVHHHQLLLDAETGPRLRREQPLLPRLPPMVCLQHQR